MYSRAIWIGFKVHSVFITSVLFYNTLLLNFNLTRVWIQWFYWNRYFVQFGHWLWYWLLAKHVNDKMIDSAKLMKLSNKWIGICYQQKFRECYR